MMKKLNVIRCIFLILMLLVPFFGLVKAQTCDPNILKALEQTRVSVFNKVTKGEKVTVTIKYPLKGTTYVVSDNDGNSKSVTYTGTDEFLNIEMDEPVNVTRRYSLKMTNGDCTYQTGFNYTVTPETDIKLAYRVEHEWCGNSGAIRFNIVGTGGDSNDYRFYLKNSSDATYDTTTSLPLTGAISRSAGSYDLIAIPISGGNNLEASNILIEKDTKTPQYSLSQIPKVCGSTKVGIRVDVSSAVYPVYYTLQNHLGVDIAGKVKQTSNIFDGLDPGSYMVKVENFCGAYIPPKPITLTNAELTFTHLYSTPQNLSNKTENPIAKEFGCDYVEFENLMLFGTNLTEANNSNSYPYPMVVKFTITAPDGDKYYPTYTINNKSDLDTYIGKYAYAEALSVNNNLKEYRIPKYKEVAGVKHYRYGVWKVGAEITTRCGTQTLPEVTTHLHNPIENAELELNNEGNSPDACHKVQLRIKAKYRTDTSPKLNTYLVIEHAPTTFKYAEAGFYQITTTNSLLQGKYLKQIQYSPEYHTTILTPEFLKNGETYQFSLVDAECDTSRIQTFPPITISTPSTQVETKIQVFEVASCKDVTTTEAPYGSLKIIKEAGSAIKEIKIVKYTDTNGVVYTSGAIPGGVLTLPYTLTDSNRVSDTKWYVRDLPKGTYEVAATNVCNVVTLAPPRQIKGQQYPTLRFSEGCNPKVEGEITHEQPFNGDDQESNFAIQRFNPATQNWDEHLRAGLGRKTPLNATTADEGLGNEGKFRIVRRVFNSERDAYECEMVIAEKEFKGDLKEPKIVGFPCNGGATRHVMVIPQGGTGPYIYKLVHKLPAGSTVPDTSVSQTQAGNNFFLNLDGSNNSIAYKFSVTDACPSSKESEITVLNIRKPTIEANQTYFCDGQRATLTIADLGPDVIIEWYNTNNPSVTLATGTTYTIPSLTTNDFGTYRVRLKIPSHTDIQNCVENAVAPFTIAKKDVVLPTIPTSNSSVEKCLTQNEDFDITSLFTGIPPSLPGDVTDRIIEASGVVQVYNNKTLPNGNPDPKYRTIPLRLNGSYQKPKGIGSFTFYYQILSPCGKVERQQEVKLTVRLSPKYIPKPIIKICKANITLDEIKQEVISGTPEIAALQPVFKWYSSRPNAEAKISEQPGTTSLDMTHGPYTYFVRLSHPNYCDRIDEIKIERETTFAAKTLTNDGCAVTNIASLKALVDPDDVVNVLIYKDGVQQADDAIVEGNTGYTYAKKNAYNCPISPAPLNFVFTPRVQAKNEKVKICAYIGYYGGFQTTVKEIKEALKKKYPLTTAMRIWYQDNNGLWHERTDDNEGTSINTNYRFMLKQTGMCDSVIYSLRLELNEQTPIAAQTITICDQITVGELIAKLQSPPFNYPNVKIHQGRGTENMSDDTFVDWNNSIYFSAQETGKCRSIKETLSLIKDTNITQADPKTFEVCMPQGQQPKVSDLKAVAGANAKIFVRDNSNRWVLQADTQNVYEANSYFYTIEEAGKCPSEKTALVVRITRKTTTPNAPDDPKYCSGKMVSHLKTYIASKGVTGTIKIYESATATTELADNVVLENNKPYHFTTQDSDPQHCESNRVALTVTIYANPAITTQPAASSTPCKGTPVSLSVAATGDGTLSYEWFSNMVDNNTGGTPIANTNSNTYTPSTDTAGQTKYYYVKVTSNTGCTAAVSNTAKVVVKQPTVITAHPVNAPLYCMGDTPYPGPLSVTATGEGTLHYQWYASNSNSYSGTAIPGATGFQYNYPTNQEGVTFYYVEVTGECGTERSHIAGVGIRQYARFKSDGNLTASDNATYCKDAATVSKLIVRTEGSVNPLYQWYKALDATSQGEAINNAWSNEYTPDVSQPGIYYYYVQLKTTDCPGIANSARAKIVVNKTTAIVDDLSEDEVNYCKDTRATDVDKLSVTAEGTGTLSYQWYSVTNGTSTAITGATTHEYAPLTTEEGTTYYYVKVSSTCGEVTSKHAKITITKPTKITTDLLEDEVNYCKDTRATDVGKLSVTAEGTGTLSYQWYSVTNGITTTITGATTHEYAPLTTEEGTTYYYVKVSSTCGEVTSKRAKITITKPTGFKPNGNLRTDEVKYCKDEPSPAALTVEAEGTGNLSYTWYKVKEGTSIVTQITGQTTATLAASAIEVATRGTTYYYVVVHSDCGSDVTSAHAKVTITDPDTPTVSDQTFCNAATVDDLRPNDSDIKWYASPTGGAPLTDGTRALAHGNKYYAARTLGSCESARAEVTVTIISLAKPIVTRDTPAACGQPSVWAITTGFDTNATYSFVKEDGTPVSTGQLTGASHKITGLDPGRYQVIATKVSCTQKSDVFEVKAALRVPDRPDLEIVPASCGVLTKAKVNNHVAGQTYWYNGTRIDYDETSHELTLAPGNYTIKAKNREGCESAASIPFVIEAAKPKPIAPVVSLTPETCEKRTVAKVENHVAGQTYWYNGTEIHYDTASHELTLDPGSYTIIAKNTAGCESEASNIDIKDKKPTTRIVNDPADATYQLNETNVRALTATINGTALSYKWYKNTTRDYTNGEEVATTATYEPKTDVAGTFYYWLEITAECGGDKTRSGIAKIEVIDQHRKAIRAIDDNFGKISNTANTTTTQSIFSSGVDTMEGVLGVLTTNEVDIHYGELKHNGTVLTQPDANITLNGDGTLSVKQNTPEGQYEYTYKICEKGTTNCSNEATVKFEVTATRIIANDDGIWEVGRTGGLLPNVLDNDVLGGQIGLTVSDVIIERNATEAAPDPKISIETDGRVSVKSGLTPGDYIYYYTIKERANVANVANAKVRIKVVNFAAVGDEFELVNTPTQEQTTPSVLLNDELDNTKGLTTPGDNLSLTPGDKSLDTLFMNPDGTITIPPGTPNGTYRYNYRICTLRPAECREAQAVIKLYTVIAKEDDYSSTPVNTTLEAKTIGNVLEDDDYPGKPDYSNVDLSVVGNSHNIELKPNGDVVVPQGMPAGNYVIRYRLCIAGQTDDNSCQEANIKIVVFQDKPLTIYNGISADGDGHNDSFIIEGIELYPDNNLKIFNRWGVLVYEKDGYRNDTEPFDGHSNGRATISAGSKLPQGTYYYILEYQDSVGQTQTNQGWLYLKY